MPAALVFQRAAPQQPTTAETAPTIAASMTIQRSRSVSNWAVAAGTISMAITRIEPTASNEATVAVATMPMKR